MLEERVAAITEWVKKIEPLLPGIVADHQARVAARLREALGLDQPFIVQFWHFLQNAAQGEFGFSLRQGTQVSALIAERLPATLELALVAGLLESLFRSLISQPSKDAVAYLNSLM
jgi:ABC-type dipeptide/oligopeptide/nickel transport system permease component